MLEKLKNLNYVSLRESDTLDKMTIIFIDEKNKEGMNVYQKTVTCGSFEIDEIENIPKVVEKLFIDRINMNIKEEQIINCDKEKINTLIDNTITNLTEINKKFSNEDKFILVPEDLIDVIFDEQYDVIVSEYLNNEIIFGYKTISDQPGIILIANENSFKDKNDIRIAITDLGFFPEKSYYKIIYN